VVEPDVVARGAPERYQRLGEERIVVEESARRLNLAVAAGVDQPAVSVPMVPQEPVGGTVGGLDVARLRQRRTRAGQRADDQRVPTRQDLGVQRRLLSPPPGGEELATHFVDP